MTLRWTKDVLGQLRPWSEKCYPYEGCALLLGRFDSLSDRRAVRLSPLTNVLRHRDKSTAAALETAADTLGARAQTQGQFEFVMDPMEFNRAVLAGEKENLDVVGVLHTHPDHPAQPSATDAAQPLLAGWSNVIVKVDKGAYVEARSWFRAEEHHPFQEEAIELVEE